MCLYLKNVSPQDGCKRAHPPEEPEKGTYVLVLYLRKGARLEIGRLGRFDFKRGYYAYVGSAFGPGGLSARLKHHRTHAKKPHWHIDYLRRAATVKAIWVLAGPERKEHDWAARLNTMEKAQIPVNGFGASDCKCPAHLFYFSKKPSATSIRKTLPGTVRHVI